MPRRPRAPAKAEQEATAKAIEEYRAAATTLPSAAGAAECVWTGRRIASLLWRDDIDTARRYIDLYDRFGCSPEHLKLVFRCVIQQGPLDPKAADRLASRVHDCWMAPEDTDNRREPGNDQLHRKRRNNSKLKKFRDGLRNIRGTAAEGDTSKPEFRGLKLHKNA